ncbi:MAG: hypothetical protein WEB88_05360 [Gemmatimonadota bacterium]
MMHPLLRLAAFQMLVLEMGCSPGDYIGDGSPGAVPAITLDHVSTFDGHASLYGSVQAVVADDSGQIYVSDTQYRGNQQIVVISPNGVLRRSIGRQGEGPGEFQALVGPTWVGQQILAMDVRLRRFTFFEPSGRVARTWAWDWPFVTSATPPLMSGGSSAYALVRAVNRQVQGQSDSQIDEYLIFRADGTVEDAPRVSEPEMGPSSVVCLMPDGVSFQGGPLPYFDRGPLRAFLPNDRLALAYRDTFRIDIVDIHSQEVVKIIRRPYPRVSVSGDEWESQPEIQFFRDLAREAGTELRDRNTGGPCASDDLRPDFLPILRTIVSDDTGQLLVEATAADGNGFTFTLYDSTGSLIGETRMPDRDPDVRPYFRGDRLYIGTIDSLGVQSIEVYEIRLPSLK